MYGQVQWQWMPTVTPVCFLRVPVLVKEEQIRCGVPGASGQESAAYVTGKRVDALVYVMLHFVLKSEEERCVTYNARRHVRSECAHPRLIGVR